VPRHLEMPKPVPNRPEVNRAIWYATMSRLQDNAGGPCSRWRLTSVGIGVMVGAAVLILAVTLALATVFAR
jgi:hypothetical protein